MMDLCIGALIYIRRGEPSNLLTLYLINSSDTFAFYFFQWFRIQFISEATPR